MQYAAAQQCDEHDRAIEIGKVSSISGSKITATVAPGDVASEQFQVGGLVRVATRTSDVYGLVQALWLDDGPNGAERRTAEIQLLGEVEHGPENVFARGVSVYPALGATVHSTTRDELALIYASPSVSTVRVGSLFQDPSVPAYVVTDDLLGKHFAILGTTGCGKSCTVALILRAILAEHPAGHVVMLDPHNEYSHAFGDQAEVVRPSDLDLPYWLLNFEEAAAVMTSHNPDSCEQETAILKSAILEARRKHASSPEQLACVTVDTPSPYRLSDVIKHVDTKMCELTRADPVTAFLRVKGRLEALTSDTRLSFMFPGHMVRDNLEEILGRLLRIPVASKPVTLLDISGLPAEVVDVVVSVICRTIFDFSLWSERDSATPILLVCEEAHRYAPQTSNPAFEPTKRALSRIAKEGRKYGIALGLVSQRPSELCMSIVSQCNTLFALRMSNERDHEFVRNALPECAQSFLSSLPALRTQEAIVVGEGVTVPMRLRFDDLPSDHRPQSDTARFSERWAKDCGDDSFIAETVHRWRRQTR